MKSRLPSSTMFDMRKELDRLFGDLVPLCQQAYSKETKALDLDSFFAPLGATIAKSEVHQRERNLLEATQFNVFNLIDPDENRLSDVLRILLDPRGIHGQGDLFLRLFLEQAKVVASPDDLAAARVRREVPTYAIKNGRRRIDILIEAGVLLAIENKVDSGDQHEQVQDYLAHLEKCSAIGKRNALVYLTPSGLRPCSLGEEATLSAIEEQRLYCWSYAKELSQWLDACRTKCQAAKIEHFLGDFIAYINTVLRRASIGTEGTDNAR